MPHDKYSCLARANKFLADPDEVGIRYAALELRFCMESITYEKLKASAKHIPPSILKKWQPPQAVKALLEHQPEGDRPFTIFAGIEGEHGVPCKDMKFVGTHTPFRLNWLRKHYNKIGKLLHYQFQETLSFDQALTYLREVTQEVESVAKSNIQGGWLGEVYCFDCSKCSQPITVAKHSVESGRHLACQNPNCGAEYFGRIENGADSATFQLKVTAFNCVQCDAQIPIENRFLKVGLEFKCDKCRTGHRLVNRQWSYSPITVEE